MTAPTVAGARAWAAEVDVDQALDALRARFPRAMIWHGEFTGSLWGAWRDRTDQVHLVEAADPEELRQRLEDADAQAVQQRAAAGVPGTGGMVARVWTPPPLPTSTSTPSRLSPPQRTVPPPPRREVPERPEPPKRPVRGRHEVEGRRGWLRRLLDRLTYTGDDWEW